MADKNDEESPDDDSFNDYELKGNDDAKQENLKEKEEDDTPDVVYGFKDLVQLVPELSTDGGWLKIFQEDNSLSVRIKRDDGTKVTKFFDFEDSN